MDDPKSRWKDVDQRTGHWQVEAKINLLAVKDLWIKYRRNKRKRTKQITETQLYEWVYECG